MANLAKTVSRLAQERHFRRLDAEWGKGFKRVVIRPDRSIAKTDSPSTRAGSMVPPITWELRLHCDAQTLVMRASEPKPVISYRSTRWLAQHDYGDCILTVGTEPAEKAPTSQPTGRPVGTSDVVPTRPLALQLTIFGQWEPIWP